MDTVKPDGLDDYVRRIYKIVKADVNGGYEDSEDVRSVLKELKQVEAKKAEVRSYAKGAADAITDMHNQGLISGLSKAESIKRIYQRAEAELQESEGEG